VVSLARLLVVVCCVKVEPLPELTPHGSHYGTLAREIKRACLIAFMSDFDESFESGRDNQAAHDSNQGKLLFPTRREGLSDRAY
jgi:hypothetical protein